jgi:ribosome biogenesis protein MAK21
VKWKNLFNFFDPRSIIQHCVVQRPILTNSAKMGKHRKAPGKAGKGPGPATGANSATLPSFDEKALSALTEKIEQGFGKSKTPHQLPDPTNGKPGKEKLSKGRRDSDSMTKTTEPERNRGTKRDAQGNVKAGGKGKAENSRRETTENKGEKSNDRDVLLKEILALGGTEEDLDLVAGAASDDEDVGGNNASAQDKLLKKDLARFVAGLGIEGAAVEDPSEPEAEVEEEDEEMEWEEASDLNESEASDEPDKAPQKPTVALPEVKKSDVSSKGPNRLVSSLPLRAIVLTDVVRCLKLDRIGMQRLSQTFLGLSSTSLDLFAK